MLNSLMKVKRGAQLNDDTQTDFRRRHSSLNTGFKHETGVHVWVFRKLSIVIPKMTLLNIDS